MRARTIQYWIRNDGDAVLVRLRDLNGAPRRIEMDRDTVAELAAVLSEIEDEMGGDEG